MIRKGFFLTLRSFQPSGTGKSSLVCAICIGLGGSTKVGFFRVQCSKSYVKTDNHWACFLSYGAWYLPHEHSALFPSRRSSSAVPTT
jgi:hypothetical protein